MTTDKLKSVLALVKSRHHCQLRSFKYAAQFRCMTRIAFDWPLRRWKRLRIHMHQIICKAQSTADYHLLYNQ